MKNKPDIRFDGFNYAWEQRRLGKYTSLITKGTTPKDKSGKGDVNFVKVENIINGNIFPLTKISDDEHENYLRRSRLEENDILFSIAGTLGRTATVDKDILPANTNQALAIIRGYKFDKNFLVTSLNGEVVNDYIRKNPTVGAQPNLSLEQVGNLVISTPKESEQAKIGYFFQTLDNLITLHQRELENYKLLKKGFLQKLFPSNGDTNPSIRFDGFTDAWEQRRLGELGSVAMNKRIFKEETSEDGDIPFFKIGTFGGNPDSYISRKKFEEYKSKYSYPEIGDLLLSVSGSIGRIVEYKGEEAYYQDSNIVWLKHDKRLINSFLKQFYSVVKWSGLEGSTIKRLYNKNILETEIKLPTIEEQYQIGTFFQSLDNLITLHQRELDNYKELKKGFLQKMFV